MWRCRRVAYSIFWRNYLRSANRFLANGFLIFVLSAACIAAHSDLYVSPSGQDSNPGTIDKPLQTLQHAADIAKPGDAVSLREGTYCQLLSVKVSGNAEQGFITFQSQPGEHAVLDGGCLTPREGEINMVELRNVSFVRIQGLELRNNRTS